MRGIIEDFTERKVQLAINAYDMIDQQICVVDKEIKLLETSIKFNRGKIPPPPTFETRAAKKRKIPKEPESEPLFCVCRTPNSGKMVQCDNEDCPIEWFHYECVGLTKTPDVWHCPTCAQDFRKKT
jgi:hypothetical protein